MGLSGTQAFILSKNLVASVVTGVKRMYFDGEGHLIIECMDGTTLKRPFLDIKNVELKDIVNAEGNVEKHLIVNYTNNTKEDVGIIDTVADIAIDDKLLYLIDSSKNKVGDGVSMEDLTSYVAETGNAVGGIVTLVEED